MTPKNNIYVVTLTFLGLVITIQTYFLMTSHNDVPMTHDESTSNLEALPGDDRAPFEREPSKTTTPTSEFDDPTPSQIEPPRDSAPVMGHDDPEAENFVPNSPAKGSNKRKKRVPTTIWDISTADVQAYESEKHCSPKLLDSKKLGPYIARPCDPARQAFREMVKNQEWGEHYYSVIPETVSPEVEAFCRLPGEPEVKYTYVRGIKASCICNLVKNPGSSQNDGHIYALSSRPSFREFQAPLRQGAEVLFLPKGKVNFLVPQCLRETANFAHLQHFFLKLDPRVYKVNYFMFFTASRHPSCMPQLNAMIKCPGKQYRRIRPELSIESKTHVVGLLKNYELKYGRECFDSSSLLPKTYDLNITADCNEFWSDAKNSSDLKSDFFGKWMIKKTNTHQGLGVNVMGEQEYHKLKSEFDSGRRCGQTTRKIVQEYLLNPLLIKGHKFDLRTYLFVASCSPKIVYAHKLFHARLAASVYDPNATDVASALTNRSLASRLGVDASKVTYPYDKFEEYFYQKGLYKNPDWLETDFYPMFFEKMAHLGRVFTCPKNSSFRSHRIHGTDFLLLNNGDMRFIEANASTAFHGEPLSVKRPVLEDFGSILAEKIRLGRAVTSADFDPRGFQLVYDESLEGKAQTSGFLPDACHPDETA